MAKSLLTGIAKPMITPAPSARPTSAPKTPPAAQPMPARAVAARPVGRGLVAGRKTVQPLPMGGRKRNY